MEDFNSISTAQLNNLGIKIGWKCEKHYNMEAHLI